MFYREHGERHIHLVEAESAIRRLPNAWPPYDHGTRRYLLRRYPFGSWSARLTGSGSAIDEDSVFLKTIIPSRKATTAYLGEV